MPLTKIVKDGFKGTFFLKGNNHTLNKFMKNSLSDLLCHHSANKFTNIIYTT